MTRLSPSEKAIIAIQKEYENSQSKEVRITKADFNDILFREVGSVLPIVSTARNVLIGKGYLLWPSKSSMCVILLDKIKSEAI